MAESSFKHFIAGLVFQLLLCNNGSIINQTRGAMTSGPKAINRLNFSNSLHSPDLRKPLYRPALLVYTLFRSNSYYYCQSIVFPWNHRSVLNYLWTWQMDHFCLMLLENKTSLLLTIQIYNKYTKPFILQASTLRFPHLLFKHTHLTLPLANSIQYFVSRSVWHKKKTQF